MTIETGPDINNPEALEAYLESLGIDTSHWGRGRTLPVDQLFEERKSGESVILPRVDENERLTVYRFRRLALAWAGADDEYGRRHQLVQLSEKFPSGAVRKVRRGRPFIIAAYDNETKETAAGRFFLDIYAEEMEAEEDLIPDVAEFVRSANNTPPMKKKLSSDYPGLIDVIELREYGVKLSSVVLRNYRSGFKLNYLGREIDIAWDPK